MSYFVRKISKSKWLSNTIDDNPFDIPSDVISADLRTQGNTLSVWEIEDVTKLDDAVLAITSSGDKLETIDVVWIAKSEIEQKNVEYVNNLGITPIESLKDKHNDLCQLNYFKLGLVAESIADKIASDIQTKKYTKGDLKKLYNLAIESGIVSKPSLKEGISKELA